MVEVERGEEKSVPIAGSSIEFSSLEARYVWGIENDTTENGSAWVWVGDRENGEVRKLSVESSSSLCCSLQLTYSDDNRAVFIAP